MSYTYDSDGNLIQEPNFSWVDNHVEPLKITVTKAPPAWVDSTPTPLQNPDASPVDIAAYRVAKSVKRPSRLPVEQTIIPEAPTRPSYVMEPDLQEAQGGMQLPPGMMQDDSGRLFYADDPTTTIPMVRRPGLLPIANTPEGLKFAIPKLLDLAGNVMGNVGGVMGGKVAAKAGEMVLGSGMVRKGAEEVKAAEPFYSQLERTVKDAKIEKADAAQWLGYLKNQPGVKSEEISTVLGGKLPEGQISRSQLEDIVKQNKVELGEKVLGGNLSKEDTTRFNQLDQESANRQLTNKEAAELEGLLQKQEETKSVPKYSSYQLPGGENYKEMLLKLPESKATKDEIAQNIFKLNYDKLFPGQKSDVDKYFSKGLASDKENFQSSHWDEPNVLAHIRMNDRNLPVEFTADEKAALQKHEEAQSYLDKLRQSQADVGKAISTASKPLEAARRAKILADNKAGKLSNVDTQKALEEYVDHPELKPLQDKLSKLRQEEYNIRKSLPTKPEQKLQKVLHIEEIQSDLHQKGRDLGYKGEVEKLQPDFDKIEEKLMATNDEKMLGQATVKDVLKEAVDKKIITPAEAKIYQRYTDIENHKHEAIPDLPFKNNWEELALKRIVRHAAENGYDAISWEHGNAQALRYPDELRKSVKNIEWFNNISFEYGDGLKHITAHSPDGNSTKFAIDKNGIVLKGPQEAKGKKLDEVIGKSMAKDILEKDKGNIDAKDFVMGAEGMKAAYDVRLLNKINEIGKKYGSKVEEKEIPNDKKFFVHKIVNQHGNHVYDVRSGKGKNERVHASFSTGDEAAVKALELSKGKPIHYFPITPALRDKATKEGFPLFSSGPTLIPVDHSPQFEDKKSKYKLTPVQGNPFQ